MPPLPLSRVALRPSVFPRLPPSSSSSLATTACPPWRRRTTGPLGRPMHPSREPHLRPAATATRRLPMPGMTTRHRPKSRARLAGTSRRLGSRSPRTLTATLRPRPTLQPRVTLQPLVAHHPRATLRPRASLPPRADMFITTPLRRLHSRLPQIDVVLRLLSTGGSLPMVVALPRARMCMARLPLSTPAMLPSSRWASMPKRISGMGEPRCNSRSCPADVVCPFRPVTLLFCSIARAAARSRFVFSRLVVSIVPDFSHVCGCLDISVMP